MAILVAAEGQVAAQCSTQWVPWQDLNTGQGVWTTMWWDRDGAGPLPPVLVVGGNFISVGSVPYALHIATYDPGSGVWSALQSGLYTSSSNAPGVHALATLPNGDLVVGGEFVSAWSISCNRIARWDGTWWWPFGSGMDGPVHALTTLPNGDIVAGGSFTTAGGVSAPYIARWNGTNWSALGTGVNGWVEALMTLPNGDLLAGGFFTTAGGVSTGSIARWNGTSWLALGSGVSGPPTFPPVNALTTLPNGDIVAAGNFTSAGGVSAMRIARWNGANWSALGTGVNGPVAILTTLPNGDLLAGGIFTSAGGVSAARIARWDGANWSALGSGTDGGVGAFATLPNGNLLVGGSFTLAGGGASFHLAQLTTTCPATTVAFGAGCTGSAGPNELNATSLPWAGSTFTSIATGMPAISLAMSVIGFSTVTLPLPSILPQGVAGCTLWVSPDLLVAYLPTAGSVTTQIAIPNAVALAGQVLHQQVVPLEFDAASNLVALTSTNALTLTIGAF